MSIYKDMRAAGVKTDNHESDMYAIVNDASRAIVGEYEYMGQVTQFRSEVDGEMWFDIPFAFDPFWEKKSLQEGARP